jgi:hypothetical protein
MRIRYACAEILRQVGHMEQYEMSETILGKRWRNGKCSDTKSSLRLRPRKKRLVITAVTDIATTTTEAALRTLRLGVLLYANKGCPPRT